MARFYSNENFPLPVVLVLRAFGHDVVTIQERGQHNSSTPDDDVLMFARLESRIILTLNRKDFIRLHRLTPNHSGIVVCTVDPDFAGQAARIHHAISADGDLAGQLIRINRPNPD